MKSRISSVFSTFLQISRPQKKSQTYSNLYALFDEIYWISGILEWHCHRMPKAGNFFFLSGDIRNAFFWVGLFFSYWLECDL